MLKPLVILVAVGGLVAAGTVEGLRTNRWGASEDVRAAAARLAAVPAQAGPWRGGGDRVMDPQVVRVAEAAGYVDRTYSIRGRARRWTCSCSAARPARSAPTPRTCATLVPGTPCGTRAPSAARCPPTGGRPRPTGPPGSRSRRRPVRRGCRCAGPGAWAATGRRPTPRGAEFLLHGAALQAVRDRAGPGGRARLRQGERDGATLPEGLPAGREDGPGPARIRPPRPRPPRRAPRPLSRADAPEGLCMSSLPPRRRPPPAGGRAPGRRSTGWTRSRRWSSRSARRWYAGVKVALDYVAVVPAARPRAAAHASGRGRRQADLAGAGVLHPDAGRAARPPYRIFKIRTMRHNCEAEVGRAVVAAGATAGSPASAACSGPRTWTSCRSCSTSCGAR